MTRFSRVLALFCLAAAILPPRAARAQVAFTPEGAVLQSSAAAQAVVSAGGVFRMYFVRDGLQVLSSTSTDQATWSLESGVRLGTGALAELDAASITACGILPLTAPAGSLRMFYVGVSTAGTHSLLSATSTDGLSWSKEAGVRLRAPAGSDFMDSPRPFRMNGSLTRLFYVADSSGAQNPSNYRIFSASSTDDGLTLGEEGVVLSAEPAFQVSVASLTDARTRLYYSAPVSGSTVPVRVLSAISANGLLFSKESGVRLSTSASFATLTHPVVVRSTESFRWRMFSSYTPAGSTVPYASSALTLSPAVVGVTPSLVLNSQSTAGFVVAGEIFSPSPTLAFTLGTDTMTLFGLGPLSDISISASADPLGRNPGLWTLIVTNQDGQQGALSNALRVDTPPGNVTVLDNLFRPLLGGRALITVRTFDPGRVTLKLYTVSGSLVATLFDQDAPAGTTTVAWNGRTALGNAVASGLYLLRARGPKLDSVEKIVVIK